MENLFKTNVFYSSYNLFQNTLCFSNHLAITDARRNSSKSNVNCPLLSGVPPAPLPLIWSNIETPRPFPVKQF
jgi:hypothetical protein